MIKDKQFYKFFADLLLDKDTNAGDMCFFSNDLHKFCMAIASAKRLYNGGNMSDDVLKQFINELTEKYAENSK